MTKNMRSVAPVFASLGLAFLTILFSPGLSLSAAETAGAPLVTGVELQPLSAQIKRVEEALDAVGAPLSESEKAALQAATSDTDAATGLQRIQEVLDLHCLVIVDINPEMRVKVAQGPAKLELVEDGWRTFLVKVHNQAGATAELRVVSPNAQSVHDSPWKKSPSDEYYRKNRGAAGRLTTADRWLDLEVFNRQPLKKDLSGLSLEYRLVSLYSRDAGQREAKLGFDVGQGTQDLGFRSEVDLLFRCAPASEVRLKVLDELGQPTTAMFIIRDAAQRVYPSQAKRLAPDFAFHPQIYRADGESVRLPEGDYQVEFTRGPEYLIRHEALRVKGREQTASFKLERWIDLGGGLATTIFTRPAAPITPCRPKA